MCTPTTTATWDPLLVPPVAAQGRHSEQLVSCSHRAARIDTGSVLEHSSAVLGEYRTQPYREVGLL